MTEATDFWSRRKARVQAEEAAEQKEVERLAVAEAHAELEEKSDEEILHELKLPDPDTMGPGDDFSAFMAQAVPDRIRRRALRKLWLTNPTLANVDGLIDYGEDFTDAALVVENLQTAYQVGKGMLKHVLELEKSETDDDGEEEETPEEETSPALVLDVSTPETVETAAIEVAELPEAEDYEEDLAQAPTTRRMRFSYAS